MADNYVITISREHGSRGNHIGKLVADRLGIGFYDYKLIRLASDRSGINEALFGAADEDVHRPTATSLRATSTSSPFRRR